jgi:SAM-dependent methyltransferase
MKPSKIKILRAKSPIHERVIDERGRRRIDGDMDVQGIIEGDLTDTWDKPGRDISKYKLQGILTRRGLNTDIRALKKRETPINIMVLGPGEGAEVLLLNEKLKGTKIGIDTLGLTNNLSPEAKEIIRKDYSPEKLTAANIFENMNHLKMVRKYDYVYSRFGPLSHTHQPEIVILKVASLLKPGGFARFYPIVFSTPMEIKEIIINCQKYLAKRGYKKAIKFKVFADNLIIIREK